MNHFHFDETNLLGGPVLHILMIENDAHNAELVEQSFRKSKYQISKVSHEACTIDHIRNPNNNLIVLDIHAEIAQSLELLSALRRYQVLTPVLVLCPGQAVQELLPYMEANEFDFLLKPVSVIEMKVRANALLRKSHGIFEKFHLKSAGIILDLISRQVYRGEQLISLQKNEFELLEFLMRNAGRVITKTEILEKIWNYSFDPQTNVVDVLVWRLRAKIDKHFSNKVIQTVRGVGYTFRPA
jgi:two-component system OmpR family response regulator